MVFDDLRTRIITALLSEDDVALMADAVIRELEPELNRHDTGCVCDDCWPDQEGD